MSVRTVLSVEFEKVKEFPKLMISISGSIVLFKESQSGFVIHPSLGHCLGYFSNNWWMPDFKEYQGELTLKNE